MLCFKFARVHQLSKRPTVLHWEFLCKAAERWVNHAAHRTNKLQPVISITEVLLCIRELFHDYTYDVCQFNRSFLNMRKSQHVIKIVMYKTWSRDFMILKTFSVLMWPPWDDAVHRAISHKTKWYFASFMSSCDFSWQSKLYFKIDKHHMCNSRHNFSPIVQIYSKTRAHRKGRDITSLLWTYYWYRCCLSFVFTSY